MTRVLQEPITRDDLLNTKLEVLSEEHSQAFQLKCFSLGIAWLNSGTSVVYTYAMRYLYVSKKGYLTYGYLLDVFETSNNEEIQFDHEKEVSVSAKRHKHYDMIVAWAAGAAIQSRPPFVAYWRDVDMPAWEEDFEYRIRPKTIHKVGNKYKRVNKNNKPIGTYILADVAHGNKVALISIEDGTRWAWPVTVSNPLNLSDYDWKYISEAGRFELISPGEHNE